MGRLAGKNTIITGAAGGIGLETSILFAKEGANVLMSDINEEQLNKAVKRVKEFTSDVVVEGFVSQNLPRSIVKDNFPPALIRSENYRSAMSPRKTRWKKWLPALTAGADWTSSSTTPVSCTQMYIYRFASTSFLTCSNMVFCPRTTTPSTPPRLSGT
jgi:NAD(P)-dependent dehydrogenase (short-subunit alcohol dehydrogenase family)